MWRMTFYRANNYIIGLFENASLYNLTVVIDYSKSFCICHLIKVQTSVAVCVNGLLNQPLLIEIHLRMKGNE